MGSYHIAAPDEYLAITGMGIGDVKITKSAWVWPLQRCTRFSIQPRDYSMELQAMTKEKLQFSLPVVFTVGPDVNQRSSADASHNDITDRGHEDRGDALIKYAMLLANSDSDSDSNTDRKTSSRYVENIVKGIIEGETRVLVSDMTMEDIFAEREVFKKRLYCNIQSELSQFGLRVFNAVVKDLHDAPSSVYIESLLRKGRGSTSIVAEAEAQPHDNIGNAKDLLDVLYADFMKLYADFMKPYADFMKPKEADSFDNSVADQAITEPHFGILGTVSESDQDRPGSQDEGWWILVDRKYQYPRFPCPFYSNRNLNDLRILSDGFDSIGDVVEHIRKHHASPHHGDSCRPTRPAHGHGHGHGHGDSLLDPMVESPLAGRSKSNGHHLPPHLAKLMSGVSIVWGLGLPIALAHRIPDWLLHVVGGTTVAASACVPALQPAQDEAKAYRMGAYIAWAVTFAIFIAMELYRRQDQRRLLLGLVVFCGANLLGSLAEDSSSTIDTIKNWGPLALSLSLWVVPEWIQFLGARNVVDAVAGA